jgi:hypothetical protein
MNNTKKHDKHRIKLIASAGSLSKILTDFLFGWY